MALSLEEISRPFQEIPRILRDPWVTFFEAFEMANQSPFLEEQFIKHKQEF